MASHIGRRKFLAALGGAAAWPLAASAQQSAMPFIGLLNGQSSTHVPLPAFRQGLSEAGFDEGRNVAVVYRSADGDRERLPALAAELVRLRVAVIAAVGGDSSALSAKAATATIPIVFTTGGDPVESGIVASLSRPGGNVTGATILGSMAATKQIGLLRDMVPRLETIGLLVTPLATAAAITASAITRDVQSAAQAAGIKAVVMEVNSERDLDTAFAQLVKQRVDALVIGSFVIFYRYWIASLRSQRSIKSLQSSSLAISPPPVA